MAHVPTFSLKTGLFLIAGIIGCVLSIAGVVTSNQGALQQSSHQASLAYLQASTQELLAFSPSALIEDDRYVTRFRDINPQFVEQFQYLKYGNDTAGAPPLLVSDQPPYTALLKTGDSLLEKYGAMIQSRKDINKYRQFNKRLLSETMSLSGTAATNLHTSEQQNLAPALLKPIMQLSYAIQEQHNQVAYSVRSLQTHGKTLLSDSQSRQKATRRLIQSLTESQSRLPNPVMRRMYVNLNEQLEQHYDSVATIESVLKDYARFQQSFEQFTLSLITFTANLDETRNALSSSPAWGSLLLIVGLVITGIGTFGMAWSMRSTQLANTNRTAKASADPLEYATATKLPQENTQQRKQVITERNQLIHDIQPIMDGVFYVEANELSETTGDIAKAFNGARRSIVKRVQLIQQEITRLKQLQTTEGAASQPPVNQTEHLNDSSTTQGPLSEHTDIKACVDITFDTQAKIEQLRRWQSPSEVSGENRSARIDAQLEALMQCQDHLRVRLRDMQKMLQGSPHQRPDVPSNAITTANAATTDFERLSRLVNSFQLTEARRTRQRKPLPAPPVNG